MSRPLCESRRSPTRPGPATPGRAAAAPLGAWDSGLKPAAPCASRSGPLFPLLPGPRRPGGRATPLRAPSPQRPGLPFLVSSSFPRVAGGPARVTRRPSAFPRLPLTTRPLRPAPFLPRSGPALISLFPLSVFFRDDLLLGDVPSSRRDQKVKETKVSWAPPVAAGRGGHAGQWGRGLGDAPRGKDISEAARFAGASRRALDPFGVCAPAAYSLTTSNS